MRRIYPLSTGYLANSEAVKKDVCRRDHLAAEDVAVIHNGIEVADHPFVDHLESDVAVGIVGNLNRRVKRQDLFLKAAARVAPSHPEVSWHLIGDGQFRAEYEAMAQDLGLAGRVVFPGQIADVSGYLKRIGVGVLCSDSEA